MPAARGRNCGFSPPRSLPASHARSTWDRTSSARPSTGRAAVWVDADRGGGVIKQCVARQGQGRSGGFRTIIAFRSGDRSIFKYGFAKNRKTNLTDDELVVYRRLAEIFLEADNALLGRMLTAGELKEVDCDDQEER